MGTQLLDSIGQSNRILLNITSDYNGRLLAADIKAYFEANRNAVEVLLFKGKKTISEKTFKGCVPQIIKQTMDYFRTYLLLETVQKVSGRAEANRFWNYPYDALEEAVVNSMYHRDYQQHEPVEITIEPEGVSILNCPGPDRSIPMSAIEKGDNLKSRRYRNRRLGDFLKELDLT